MYASVKCSVNGAVYIYIDPRSGYNGILRSVVGTNQANQPLINLNV